MATKDKSKADVTPKTPRTLNAKGVARHVERLEGWSLDGTAIRRDFAFDSPDAAMQFVRRVIRKAAVAARPIDMRLNGPTVGLKLEPLGELLTRSDLTLAKRLGSVKAA